MRAIECTEYGPPDKVLRLVDVRANLLRVGDVLEGAALDKYSFTRDAYLQKRRADISSGSRRADDDAEGTQRRGRDKDDPNDGQIPPDPNDGQVPPDPDGQPSR